MTPTIHRFLTNIMTTIRNEIKPAQTLRLFDLLALQRRTLDLFSERLGTELATQWASWLPDVRYHAAKYQRTYPDKGIEGGERYALAFIHQIFYCGGMEEDVFYAHFRACGMSESDYAALIAGDLRMADAMRMDWLFNSVFTRLQNLDSNPAPLQ